MVSSEAHRGSNELGLGSGYRLVYETRHSSGAIAECRGVEGKDGGLERG